MSQPVYGVYQAMHRHLKMTKCICCFDNVGIEIQFCWWLSILDALIGFTISTSG